MKQKKEIRLEDIAKELNISTVTVSNALSGRKGVSDSLRSTVVREDLQRKTPPLRTGKEAREC